MKGRALLIEVRPDGRSRAALIVDGRLEDLLVDPPADDPAPRAGDVYLARVDRPAPKIGGAFVRLTAETTGFLRDGAGLRQGAAVPVQVGGYPEPDKAVPVSTRILLKGRRAILTPGAPGVNVARSIRDAEARDRLAAVAGPDDGAGVIVRSAARDADPAAVQAEVDRLAARWRGLREIAAGPPAPALRGPSAAEMALAEWTDPLPDAIHADGAPDALFAPWPDLADRLRAEPGPFARFGVLDEIDRLRAGRAELPSGAWMAVEPTRALVAVDVNTGGGFSAGAALSANIEAARELPRQLRLRGLGGQVTVDFAPLSKRDRVRVEQALKAALRLDPVETTVAGWTPLGHLELQRKRERRSLSEVAEF